MASLKQATQKYDNELTLNRDKGKSPPNKEHSIICQKICRQKSTTSVYRMSKNMQAKNCRKLSEKCIFGTSNNFFILRLFGFHCIQIDTYIYQFWCNTADQNNHNTNEKEKAQIQPLADQAWRVSRCCMFSKIMRITILIRQLHKLEGNSTKLQASSF
jgi:hypothetical protein